MAEIERKLKSSNDSAEIYMSSPSNVCHLADFINIRSGFRGCGNAYPSELSEMHPGGIPFPSARHVTFFVVLNIRDLVYYNPMNNALETSVYLSCVCLGCVRELSYRVPHQ